MPDGPVPARPTVTLPAVVALLRRPGLWPVAARTGWLLASPGWWRRWPPRPVPPASYAAFRQQTMFGSAPDSMLTGEQLVAYLEWCRAMRRLR